MKIDTPSHTTTNIRRFRIPAIVLVVVILCVVGLWVYIGVYHNTIFGWPKENTAIKQAESGGINLQESTKEETSTGATIKEQSQNSTTGSTQPTNSTKASPAVTLTASSYSSGTLRLRYLISGVTTNDGTCTVTVSKDGFVAASTQVATQGLASDSTCAGFDITSDTFSSGTWAISLTVKIDGYSDAILNSEVTIP